MNVSIAVDLPHEIEAQLRAESGDLSAAVRDGFFLDLFRRGLLTRHDLSQALGLDRFETFALLKRHQIFEGSLTHDDVNEDVKSIDELLGPPRR